MFANINSVHDSSAGSDAAYALPVDTSLVASGAGESAREWRPALGELVSLWDMLRVNGDTFVLLLKNIVQLRGLVDELAQDDTEHQHSQEPFENVSKKEGTCDALAQKTLDKIRLFFDKIENICVSMKLESGEDQIKRIRKSLFAPTREPFAQLGRGIQELENRIEDALKRSTFFFVASDRVKYFEVEPPPFSAAVRGKFPEAIADVEDASRCLGVGLPTAAVYHLMRVVECGVPRLCKRLNLPSHLERRSWGEMFGPMNAAIAGLPYRNTKERNRRDRYSEAMLHLNGVKGAWRNPTMHSKRRYTQEETETIFDNVKTFMHFLATKVFCR